MLWQTEANRGRQKEAGRQEPGGVQADRGRRAGRDREAGRQRQGGVQAETEGGRQTGRGLLKLLLTRKRFEFLRFERAVMVIEAYCSHMMIQPWEMLCRTARHHPTTLSLNRPCVPMYQPAKVYQLCRLSIVTYVKWCKFGRILHALSIVQMWRVLVQVLALHLSFLNSWVNFLWNV